MRKQKKPSTRKLTLSRESLRQLTLTKQQLAGVAGGGAKDDSVSVSFSGGTTIYSHSQW